MHAGVGKPMGPYFGKDPQCISGMASGFSELVLVYYGALLVSGAGPTWAETTFMSVALISGRLISGFITRAFKHIAGASKALRGRSN